MLVRVNIGGVWLYFGYPQSKSQPMPFFPYLLDIDPIADSTGDETGATAFLLALKAKDLIGLELRSDVEILNPEGTVIFAGLIGRVAYSEQLRVTVEA